jgi:hypothetical protein
MYHEEAVNPDLRCDDGDFHVDRCRELRDADTRKEGRGKQRDNEEEEFKEKEVRAKERRGEKVVSLIDAFNYLSRYCQPSSLYYGE